MPETSRNTAWVSMDGRNRQKIPIGGSILITGLYYTLMRTPPIPCGSIAVAGADDKQPEPEHRLVQQVICRTPCQNYPHAISISHCLSWNDRTTQKSMSANHA